MYTQMKAIRKEILRQIQLRYPAKTRILLALDGRCGSGKSTLADYLRASLPATVIPADDFFLRPEQRTPERYSEAGGNLDRERLTQEVLIPLVRGDSKITYRPFDCHTFSLGEKRQFTPLPIIILEGTYTCHPALWDYCDLHLFADVDQDEQLRRIIARDGEGYARQFRERWIPLEEAYFAAYAPADRCDLIVRLS